MNILKKSLSVKNDVCTGTINLFNQDFIPNYTKANGIRAMINDTKKYYDNSKIFQDGYKATSPADRQDIRLSETGLNFVSHLNASKGQIKKGAITW